VLAEIPDDREVIVHCRSGVRSADVIRILREAGYRNKLLNLKGGILAWASEVDPRLPKY
jgi:adenylyltransferase/sulfurtransferase